jgi:hypothetical protein
MDPIADRKRRAPPFETPTLTRALSQGGNDGQDQETERRRQSETPAETEREESETWEEYGKRMARETPIHFELILPRGEGIPEQSV